MQIDMNSWRFGVLAAALGVGAMVLPTGMTAQPSPVRRQVTFAKDIAPILQRSCQDCHRPGQMAPMSLLTYEDARPWARSMRLQVTKREMPPWYVDRTVGIQHFKNDRSLSDEEIATVQAWVDAGAPQGNPADMPSPRQFNDDAKWTMGEPDLIVTSPAFTVAAEGPDYWADVYVDNPLKEDRYIQSVETKPSKDGFLVNHHALLFDRNNEQGLSHYTPGKTVDVYPTGTGRLLEAGGQLRFNLHYHSNGKQVVDQVRVAFKFFPKGYVPKYKYAGNFGVSNNDLDIPAGAKNVRADGYRVLDRNIMLTSYFPHMHARGTRQCVEAIYQTGQVVTINCVGWNFLWQIPYTYADGVQPLLPKGTVLHTISYYDNSSSSPYNPDPENWAGYGQRTQDDMSATIMSGLDLTDEQYAELAQARRQARTSGQQRAEGGARPEARQ